MTAMIDVVRNMQELNEGKVEPDSVDQENLSHALMECMAEQLNVRVNLGDDYLLDSFSRKLDYTSIGQLLLKFPLTETDNNPDSRPNRALALAVADELGPDWAQALYRFAVLVTKLA